MWRWISEIDSLVDSLVATAPPEIIVRKLNTQKFKADMFDFKHESY